MKYLATFHTHFDATKYHRYIRKMGAIAQLKPVPRKLSSSCGSCVVFSSAKEFPLEEMLTPDVERLYQVEGDNYLLLGENE
ncbi:MAG: DUF3343 domain-containing protein [Anaerovoracaceae bacterium]|jgi:hypothetical protein